MLSAIAGHRNHNGKNARDFIVLKTGPHMKQFFQSLAIFAWWIICLFASAGRLTWNRGWICTVLYLGALLASEAVIKKLNPGLLEQREKRYARTRNRLTEFSYESSYLLRSFSQ
jgi:hypothetical protein